MAAAEARSQKTLTISLVVRTVPPPGVSTRAVDARTRQVDQPSDYACAGDISPEGSGAGGRILAPHAGGFPSDAVPDAVRVRTPAL
jgi:hypothetical protein